MSPLHHCHRLVHGSANGSGCVWSQSLFAQLSVVWGYRLLHLQQLHALLNSHRFGMGDASHRQSIAAHPRQPAADLCPEAKAQVWPPSKGTGVYLPMACDQPQPKAKPLSRSQSSVSAASKDSASAESPVSDLSRLDSVGYHSSETDCSYIPAYGNGFTSKIPAGTNRQFAFARWESLCCSAKGWHLT